MKFEFVLNFGKEMVNPSGPKSDQHEIPGGGGEGDSDIKGARMLVEKFEVKPERRPIWAWPSMSKYNGVLFSAPYRTEEVRPKSEIYSPKRDDEHPRPFHMGHMASPSPHPPRPPPTRHQISSNDINTCGYWFMRVVRFSKAHFMLE